LDHEIDEVRRRDAERKITEMQCRERAEEKLPSAVCLHLN
jgi:hypothetical protein